MMEFILGSIGGLMGSYTDSYLEKHSKTSYTKAFFIGFGCIFIPSALYGLVVLDNKDLLNRLLISGAISTSIGLVFGLIAVIFLFSTKRSITKKAKSQLLNQNSL
jgi:hypothetical protein